MRPTKLESGQMWKTGRNIFIVVSDTRLGDNNVLFRRMWTGGYAGDNSHSSLHATAVLTVVESDWEYCGVINWKEFNDFVKDELSRNKGDS